MQKFLTQLILTMLFVCFASFLYSHIIIVAINGTGNYTNIQEGIDNSSNGDTVLVYPGTYYENINYNGKNIMVASLCINTQIDSFVKNTIIDGNHNGSVVTFESGEDTSAVLCGFTIQNGSGTYNLHNIRGGGVFCLNSYPKLLDCIIQNNNAEFGGGIHCRYSMLSIAGTSICHNHSIYDGGGIYLRDESNVMFDSINRSNIYLNYAGCGCDIGAYEITGIEIIVDTFTVIEPDDYNTHPFESYDFDICSSKIEMINSDLYISPLGNNTNTGFSPNDPLKTISYALTKIKSDSLSSNTIYLSNGMYSQTMNGEMFPINCKDYISIQGEDKDQTILDGNDEYFLLNSHEDTNYSISNITLQNGFNDITGGGMSIHYGQDIFLKDINFINNKAEVGGGGLNIFETQGVFENLTIRNNSSDGGGGLFVSNNSNPVFINCIIDRNNTITPGWGYAGGVSCTVECNPVFINTAITNNESDETSGLSASGSAGDYCDPILINCTICDNSENPYGTIYQGDGSHISLINCILRNYSDDEVVFSTNPPAKKVTVSYSNIKGGINGINTNNNGTIIWGDGNIDEDPLFVGGDPFSYELTPQSPCIDAGTPDTTGLHLPATDLAGNQRIYNGRIDIGAYEYQGYGIDEPDTSFIHNLFLFQNKPNPFTNETEILFITADYERVEDYSLSIYNTKGQLVRRFDGTTNNFWVKTKIEWDGTDEHGRQVAPGTYLYKLEYNGHAVVRKMVKLR